MSTEYVPFRPALNGPFAKRFYDRIEHLAKAKISYPEIEEVVQEEIDWAVHSTTINPKQRRVYRAIWLLFRDLLRVGWNYRWMAGTLEITPPVMQETAQTQQEIEQAKEAVREAMAVPRQERIAESQGFIERMETPPAAGRASVPVSALIADGQSLAADLSRIAALPDKKKQLQELRQVIQPYLQLINENERCEHTGHKLSDLWRYFRLTWATPAENTPGRTMLYLIRDAARPYHPVMGIASLENAPLHIVCRDDHLGWSLEAFRARVETAPDEVAVRAEFTRLLDYITTAIDEISLKDICTPEECRNPTSALFQKLANIATRSLAERETALQNWRLRLKNREEEDDDDVSLDRSELGNISLTAEEALYRRKRADRLGRLLFAKQNIEILLKRSDFADLWQRFLARETGQNIIRTALKARKNRHIGTSIMELNVCGAIPPYNEILSGKLTALLMLSPQVVADYRERYGKRPSDIASRMKGEPVIRPAELVFIGTTSLYRIGSSQYNRLKLPAGLLREDGFEVRWQKLGKTSGYGTLHISRSTLKALEEAASSNGMTYVNHIFGEGASPKMRAMRQTLNMVLESGQRFASTELTKHSMSRLVYGVWLASNGLEFFLDEVEQPEYYFDSTVSLQDGTKKIVDYWRERWLLMRLAYTEALNRMTKFDPQTLLVSKDLLEIKKTGFIDISEEVSTMPSTPTDEALDLRKLTRNLYRGLSAYADNMRPEWLEAIHVETDLDREVMKAVEAGKSVVLTGNPGDGKTHLQRILATRLKTLPNEPVVELDASAISNSELKTKWEDAEVQGKAFCVAINEAVLKDLADTYTDFHSLQEAQRQVEQAIIYEDEPETDSPIIVFDLSRRNILSSKIVKQVLDKLTDSRILSRCAICPTEGCDLIQNQKLLQTERVRERLQALLDRISRRGYHATLRELQALVSYLLFSGRSCEKLLQESGNEKSSLPQLPYSGKGRIFELLQETFDPAQITHPVWDDILVGGETKPEDWLPEWHGRNDALDPNAWENFEVRKRAFYFFYTYGGDLLTLDSDDESEFAGFLEMPQQKALRLLIYRINRFFGDEGNRNHLRVWQSHRYNQSPRRMLYSSTIRPRSNFEIVHPRLQPTMAKAFDLAQDHVLLRLKDLPQAKLRVDFSVFELLAQAERGVPVLSLDNDASRRLWQFMEKLTKPLESTDSEVKVVILNPVTGEKLEVMVDLVEKQYLEISQGAS